MAQIDASIPLAVRLPQIRDPMEVYGNALALQSAQQRNALVARQMQADEEARASAMADEAAMREYLRMGGGERNLNALANRPRAFAAEQKRIIDAEKERAETDSKRATTRKTDSETRIKQAERAAQMLRSANDQATWTLVRDAIGREAGPDVLANIPQQFNRQMRDAMLQATLTEAERLRDETTRRSQDMTDARTRSEGAANRAVTIRGQDKLDARAREEGALNRAAQAGKVNEKPPTEGQAKAVLFGSRMTEADKVIRDLSGRGVMTGSLIKQGVESIPLIGGGLGMVANTTVASADQQQVEQAQRDFINAVLRRESGAVIADSEFANARQQYFPQPGDSPAVIAQKARNRQTAIEGMKVEAGQHWRDVSGTTQGTRPMPRSSEAPPAPQGSGFRLLGVE
ncbi:MAG: hypothetical protein MUC68_00310 [Burkholderiaceae bacterium]|nr:hypothetical protein [Burkholderiaceae bacterium]